MQQPGGRAQILKGGPGTTGPQLATALVCANKKFVGKNGYLKIASNSF